MSKVTSYSISGINPQSQEVETLVEVGYDNGTPSMWGSAYSGGGGGSSTTIQTRDPSISDVGTVGEYWYNKNTNTMYICTSANPIDSITDLAGMKVIFNDSIFVPDNVEYDVEYKKEGNWETTYDGLFIGTVSTQFDQETVYSYGLFYNDSGYTFFNQFIAGSSIDSENYVNVSETYNKTVEIIGGTDTSNVDFVDYVKENATIVGAGYTWSEVAKNKIKSLNPVTDGNLVVGYTSEGGGSQYVNAGGTTNLLIGESNNVDPADYIQRYSYENVLVGVYGNQIGIPDTTTSNASMYNNVIVGQNNHLASHSNSSTYGNLVLGYGNDVYGSSGGGATLVVGSSNGFNSYAGCCIGSGNNVNATPFEGETWYANGYSKNVIGSYNNIGAGGNNTTSILGNANTINKESVVAGINNTVNSYTGAVGGIVPVLGDSNTVKYCTSGAIVGCYNTVGDDSELQDAVLTVHSIIGRGNNITSRLTQVSGKVNNLGVDSYVVDGSFNTVVGSETVVGHNNSATQMSTVIGNYNTVANGYTMTDPTDSTKARYKGLCIGDWNTSASGGSDFIIGRNNTAGSGSYQIMGDNVNCQGGSAAIGYNIVVNSGSFAVGNNITHNSYGGGCTYIGNSIEACSSSVIIGANIKAGYMDGSTPVMGRSGTYVGANLTVTGNGYNVTVLGTYNSDDLTANDIFVLADGTYSARHNLMVGDYNHNVTFSNNVYAENIPDAPSVAGTYTLQVVVDGSGNKTYSWV